jgi:hypothetical protein
MNHNRRQRGFALIMVLGILALFLLVSILILTMTSQNSTNFGNAYQKQRYYDVAEAGIDRGLKDLDSVLPSPGSVGFLTSTPAPPPATPTSDQTALPNVPNVPYYYSYWYNASASAVNTPDPLQGSYGVSGSNTINVPGNGAVIWAHTHVLDGRDIAVETIVARFGTSGANCAICTGAGVATSGTGSVGGATAPPACVQPPTNDKICTDTSPPSPSPAPSFVPVITGGSYTYSGNCTSPCAYGDGSATPNPTRIQTSVGASTLSKFLASQGAIDQFGDVNYWKNLAATNPTNFKYISCATGCDISALSPVAPSAGQVTFVDGSMNLTSNRTLSYSGIFIVNQCVALSGQSTLSGSGVGAMTIALGTDSQCGGDAISLSGNAFWNGGTAYAANSSILISGTGKTKYVNFYGAAIAAGSVTVTGNGNFAWESALKAQTLNFGLFAGVSFAQY